MRGRREQIRDTHHRHGGIVMLDQRRNAARRGMSRRALLKRGAAVSAAGLAVTALGVEGSRLAGASAAPASAAPASTPGTAPNASNAEPLIVHIRDARTGDIEMFHGNSSQRLRDHALARTIAENWR
jgi:hypothetical protein